MTKSIFAAAQRRRLWAGFALVSILSLVACQTDHSVQPTKQAMADSTHVNDDDPPVKPDGPGGGK